MIGKAEWFKYRIFGWGLGLKTWQSYIYVVVVAALLAASIAFAQGRPLGMLLPATIFVIVIFDVIHIMTQMPKVNDERENYHQLLIERNCSFAAIAALVAMAFYDAYKNGAFFVKTQGLPFDISIIVVLGAMLLTKIGSTIYVKTKM